MLKIGIMELLSNDLRHSAGNAIHDFLVIKQYASIMPQAVAAWCRGLGHRVYYTTFYGLGLPHRLLPDDLDVVFISCFSKGSALAYATAKLLKQNNPGLLTVLGGPHAKQFSKDAIRFFDVVVKDCDKILIKEILTDFPKHCIVSTDRELTDIPGIEERLPFIRTASFWRLKPSVFSFIPVLSSTGCPYACDFCVEHNKKYTLLPLDRLEKDLRFAASHFPRVRINFYDPNFGIRFDTVMKVIEQVPHPRKRWFLTEGSLNTLTDARLKRLENAGCLCVIPGIESWTGYTKKNGLGRQNSAREKFNHVVKRFQTIHQHIPIVQANLLFGLDTDNGEDPVTLNKAFIRETPWVSHSLNIPAPFGETPLFERYQKEGRILETLPFTFYCKPYLATTIRHYDPIEFYEKLIEIFTFMTSPRILINGCSQSSTILHKAYQPIRALSFFSMIQTMKQILRLLKTDRQFYRFHTGKDKKIPTFYHQRYETLLGPYSSLMNKKERIPVLKA